MLGELVSAVISMWLLVRQVRVRVAVSGFALVLQLAAQRDRLNFFLESQTRAMAGALFFVQAIPRSLSFVVVVLLFISFVVRAFVCMFWLKACVRSIPLKCG